MAGAASSTAFAPCCLQNSTISQGNLPGSIGVSGCPIIGAASVTPYVAMAIWLNTLPLFALEFEFEFEPVAFISFSCGSYCTKQIESLACGHGAFPVPQSTTLAVTLPMPAQRTRFSLLAIPGDTKTRGLSLTKPPAIKPAREAYCRDATDRMLTPGAARSTDGFFCENGASLLLQSTAATAMTSG